MQKYALVNKNGGFEPITKEEYRRWTIDPATAVGVAGARTDLGDRLDRQTHGRGYSLDDFTAVVNSESKNTPANHIANWTKIGSPIFVGDDGLRGIDKPEGYLCTVCASLAGEEQRFQDLHITLEQAQQLVRQVQQYIDKEENT